MNRSYRSRGVRALWVDDDLGWIDPPVTIDIIDEGRDEAVSTSLVDQYGNPIMRVPRRYPVGFCRED